MSADRSQTRCLNRRDFKFTRALTVARDVDLPPEPSPSLKMKRASIFATAFPKLRNVGPRVCTRWLPLLPPAQISNAPSYSTDSSGVIINLELLHPRDRLDFCEPCASCSPQRASLLKRFSIRGVNMTDSDKEREEETKDEVVELKDSSLKPHTPAAEENLKLRSQIRELGESQDVIRQHRDKEVYALKQQHHRDLNELKLSHGMEVKRKEGTIAALEHQILEMETPYRDLEKQMIVLKTQHHRTLTDEKSRHMVVFKDMLTCKDDVKRLMKQLEKAKKKLAEMHQSNESKDTELRKLEDELTNHQLESKKQSSTLLEKLDVINRLRDQNKFVRQQNEHLVKKFSGGAAAGTTAVPNDVSPLPKLFSSPARRPGPYSRSCGACSTLRSQLTEAENILRQVEVDVRRIRASYDISAVHGRGENKPPPPPSYVRRIYDRIVRNIQRFFERMELDKDVEDVVGSTKKSLENKENSPFRRTVTENMQTTPMKSKDRKAAVDGVQRSPFSPAVLKKPARSPLQDRALTLNSFVENFTTPHQTPGKSVGNSVDRSGNKSMYNKIEQSKPSAGIDGPISASTPVRKALFSRRTRKSGDAEDDDQDELTSMVREINLNNSKTGFTNPSTYPDRKVLLRKYAECYDHFTSTGSNHYNTMMAPKLKRFRPKLITENERLNQIIFPHIRAIRQGRVRPGGRKTGRKAEGNEDLRDLRDASGDAKPNISKRDRLSPRHRRNNKKSAKTSPSPAVARQKKTLSRKKSSHTSLGLDEMLRDIQVYGYPDKAYNGHQTPTKKDKKKKRLKTPSLPRSFRSHSRKTKRGRRHRSPRAVLGSPGAPEDVHQTLTSSSDENEDPGARPTPGISGGLISDQSKSVEGKLLKRKNRSTDRKQEESECSEDLARTDSAVGEVKPDLVQKRASCSHWRNITQLAMSPHPPAAPCTRTPKVTRRCC